MGTQEADPRNAWKNWDEEKRASFTEFFNSGISYSEVAGSMNVRHALSLTRNGVASICFRQKMKRRAKAQPPRHTTVSPSTMHRMREKRQAPPVEAPGPEERAGLSMLRLPIWDGTNISGTRTVLQLSDKSCKWPYTMPDGSYGFCPNKQAHGHYCRMHGALAYRPHDQRRVDAQKERPINGPNFSAHHVGYGHHNR